MAPMAVSPSHLQTFPTRETTTADRDSFMPDPPPSSRHRGPIAQHIWGDGLLAYATALQQLRCLYEHLPRVLFLLYAPACFRFWARLFCCVIFVSWKYFPINPFFWEFPPRCASKGLKIAASCAKMEKPPLHGVVWKISTTIS